MGVNDGTAGWSIVRRNVRMTARQVPQVMQGWLLNRQQAGPGMTQPLSARAIRRQLERDRRHAAHATAQSHKPHAASGRETQQ